MMDNNDFNKIIEKSRMKIAVSNLEREYRMKENSKRKVNILKIASTTAACLILTTSLVFAKDIERIVRERFNFGLGQGVDTAAENGYIEEPEMKSIESEIKVEKTERNLGTIVERLNVGTKIDSFLMDDYNLSVEFAFQFDDNIKEIVNFDKIHQVTLSDLIVLDEEKRIIYASNMMGEEKFNEFCDLHGLEFEYGECNENYMNNGLNWFPQNISQYSNSIGLVYNMYTDEYPKSKQLDFYFTEIMFEEEYYEGEERKTERITLTGKWEIHVDIPEKMYNRSSEGYKVISCENDRFDVYAAKVMDTGFEIGIMISDIEKPEYPEELRKKEQELRENKDVENDYGEEWIKLITTSPYREMWNDYHTKGHPINVTGYNVMIIDDEKVERVNSSSEIPLDGYDNNKKSSNGCYVLNARGEKFTSTMSPSRKYNNRFVEGNQFDFYETFGMTKYDATDKITVVIDFYGEPFKIELEKAK